MLSHEGSTPWDTLSECPSPPRRGLLTSPASIQTGPHRASPLDAGGTHFATVNCFLATWAIQAHELGWTVLDLFGAHKIAPEARWDCAGLVVLIGGGRVVAMTDASATIQRPSGSPLSYSRTPALPDAMPLWHLPTT